MKVGIIAEYNPFHNGHLYQINFIKENLAPSIIVALETNYFSMRGDISVINKYDKTKVSVDNGINLVIEYPYLAFCHNADIFAKNAIKILSLVGVDTIVAGSESADLNLIKKISNLEKTPKFQDLIKANMKEGLSYRASFSNALKQELNIEIKSNDLLNLKYYDYIQEINPNIDLILIKRIGNDYLDLDLKPIYSSATSLRLSEDISSYVPAYINDIKGDTGFYSINPFSSLLKANILNNNKHQIYEAKEGIENLFTNDFSDITSLINKLQNKRYQHGRICRFISYLLLNLTKDEIRNLQEYDTIRPLGFDHIGQAYLNELKKKTKIVTTIKEGIDPYLDYELKLAKLFSAYFNEDFLKMEQKLPYIKNRYLVGSDLDDTLVTTDKSITNETKEFINDFTLKGNYFVLVSGRSYAGLYPFYQKLGIDCPLICDNGSTIVYHDMVIYQQNIDSFVFNQFLNEIKNMLHAIIDNNFKTVYTTNINLIPDFLIHLELPDSVLVQKDLSNLFDYNPVIPNLWIYENKLDEFFKILDKYQDYFDYRYWGIHEGYGDFEIFAKGSSKESALIHFAKILGIKLNNVYAFGDQLNDMSMVLSDKINGVAMINSVKELKEKATRITEKDHNSNGVIEYLKKHLDI